MLSWPTGNEAVVLQSTSNLAALATWKNLTNEVVALNESKAVTLGAPAPEQFFRLGPESDPSTLNHKLMMGYQGWFTCPNDGSPPNQWVHWFRNNNPVATNATVDFWPDIAELDADELFDTA